MAMLSSVPPSMPPPERSSVPSTGSEAPVAHALPLRLYHTVFLILMALTAVTVGAARVDLGPLNTVIMIGIAGTKATLVVLYFMHVRYASRLIPVVILSGLFWLFILFALLFADYLTRGWLGVEWR